MRRLKFAAAMAAMAVGLLMLIPTAAAQASVAKAPAPPPGFKGTPINAAAAHGATMRIIKLSPKTCTAYNRTNPGTVPGCQARLYTFGRNHQALPKGTTAGNGYWYYSYSDKECSIYGCWYWSVNLTMDGVANGSRVWQWNEGCSPGGYDTSCTWLGYLYNGGGWPYYAMQFGENSQSCVGPYNIGCFAHGQRQWIDDWGDPTTYYNW
jgi:hypothetical protein